MTLVRNRRLLLSGNKWLFFAVIALLIASCSPKVRPVAAPERKTSEKTVAKNEAGKAAEKPSEAKVSSISMLLPFSLDNLNSGYSQGTLSRANLSLDFY